MVGVDIFVAASASASVSVGGARLHLQLVMHRGADWGHKPSGRDERLSSFEALEHAPHIAPTWSMNCKKESFKAKWGLLFHL